MAAKWTLFCPITGQRHDAWACGSCFAQRPRPPPKVNFGIGLEPEEPVRQEIEVIDLVSEREVEEPMDLESEEEVEVEVIDLDSEVEVIDLDSLTSIVRLLH
jgi:hypothetical protein